jgi:hypothetical protein
MSELHQENIITSKYTITENQLNDLFKYLKFILNTEDLEHIIHSTSTLYLNTITKLTIDYFTFEETPVYKMSNETELYTLTIKTKESSSQESYYKPIEQIKTPLNNISLIRLEFPENRLTREFLSILREIIPCIPIEITIQEKISQIHSSKICLDIENIIIKSIEPIQQIIINTSRCKYPNSLQFLKKLYGTLKLAKIENIPFCQNLCYKSCEPYQPIISIVIEEKNICKINYELSKYFPDCEG